MAKIWLIESPDQADRHVADFLNGDMAVRRIASLRSLSLIMRIDYRQSPDALVFNCGIDWASYERMEKLLWASPLDCYRVYGTSRALSGVPSIETVIDDPTRKVYQFSDWVCRFDLSRYLRLMTQSMTQSPEPEKRRISHRGLELDVDDRRVTLECGGQIDNLSPKELQILRLLLENGADCVSREDIYEKVWKGVRVSSRTLDSHLSRLRKKLAGSGARIESVYGGGYVLR